jgi:hypothetical protein
MHRPMFSAPQHSKPPLQRVPQSIENSNKVQVCEFFRHKEHPGLVYISSDPMQLCQTRWMRSPRNTCHQFQQVYSLEASSLYISSMAAPSQPSIKKCRILAVLPGELFPRQFFLQCKIGILTMMVWPLKWSINCLREELLLGRIAAEKASGEKLIRKELTVIRKIYSKGQVALVLSSKQYNLRLWSRYRQAHRRKENILEGMKFLCTAT